jgi:hypothetical protein
MMMVAITGIVSVALFGAGAMLIARAGAKPPPAIRTESRRSAAEYAFNRHRALLRRHGVACLLAGVLNLGVCLATGLAAVTAG